MIRPINLRVLIPAYGCADQLPDLVNSLRIQILPKNWLMQIVIIDNGLINVMAKKFSSDERITYLKQAKNLMYINSITYCLKREGSDMILACNQDVKLLDASVIMSLAKVISNQRNNGKEAIVMPSHKNVQGKVYCNGIRRFLCLFVCNTNRKGFLGSVMNIDYFSGCFFLCSQRALESVANRIGSWPSMYLEDIAMSMEARSQGYLMFCVLDTYILHDYKPVYKSFTKSLLYMRSMYYLVKYLIKGWAEQRKVSAT